MIERLLTLNKEFYQSFAKPFSETRRRVQPGVLKVINTIPQEASILDMGCGNGELARKLHEVGHTGRYVGIDSSAELIAFAEEDNPHTNSKFLKRDLADPNWFKNLLLPFERVLCFATIHHVPDHKLRKRIFKATHTLLDPDGLFIFSVWNFLSSPRLRTRIVPWESIQLDPRDLDSEDYLLDWRRGGQGVRYVHAFTEDELEQIAAETGYKIFNSFYSDGEGGKLGYYHLWSPVGGLDL